MHVIFNFMDLPDDVLIEIISYIDNIREKLRLKRVCKRLQYLASFASRIQRYSLTQPSHLFYPNENLVNFLPIPIDELLKVAPKLIIFRQTQFYNNIFYKLIYWSQDVSILQHLRYLTLDASSSNFESTIDLILNKSIELHELQLICYKGEVDNIKSPLRCLHLKNTFVSLASVKNYIIKNGFNLKKLIYDVPNHFLAIEVGPSIMDLLENYSPKIDSIEINNVKLCEFNYTQLKELINLKITGFYITPLTCELLIIKSPNLKHFQFECCPNQQLYIDLLRIKYSDKVTLDYSFKNIALSTVVMNAR